MLKKLRLLLAVFLGGIMAFYFLDFSDITTGIPNLARIQLVPSILAGSIIIVAALVLMTFLLGRVYCSVICPLGIFQDLVAWISGKIHRKKYYRFGKEKPVLRYGFLALTGITFLLEATVFLSLLDPYSAFGRMTVNVFRPFYMEMNNLLAWIFNSFGNYTLYHTEVYVLSWTSFIVGLLTFGLIGYLSWRYGRSWCNTVCPVGTLLGFLSRYSLCKVRIDRQACVSCGLCERKCKAGCIDSKSKEIDPGRCVSCYNCLSVCHKQAITYRPVWKKSGPGMEESPDASKRQFVSTLAVLSLALPGKALAQGGAVIGNYKSWQRKNPLSPPGSQSAEHLINHCTSCHLCVAKCPSRVLKPSFLDYGFRGMMQPKMDFEHGFCNYDCTVCSEICPNGALLPLTKEEKHKLQVGKVVFVRENCIVNTDETSCGACSEHCPTQAVSMVPYKNGLTIPSVNPDICVGCGGCEYVCPVRPFRAIYVEGNPIHLQAKAFEESTKKQDIPDDFGF